MRLLLAEDDLDLQRAVKTLLERNGYDVDTVQDGQDACDWAASSVYDGFVFDWMMPRLDGIGALRRLRSEGNNTPCLMLTARDAVEDRVEGLDAGADDYLSKPFDGQELLARVRAMLRRRDAYQPDVVAFENITLDKGTGEMKAEKGSVRLNGKIYRLMELFMENPRVIFSIPQLMEKIWGWDAEAEINVVWVNISQLRKRLSEIGASAQITAHRGSGYSLEAGK